MCLMLMPRRRLFRNVFSMRWTFLDSLVVELISLKVVGLLWTMVVRLCLMFASVYIL